MQGIKRLLEKNPDLLRIESLDPEKKERRHRYEEALKYDKVDEVAKEYMSWASSIPGWKIDFSTIEKIFDFGKGLVSEYAINLLEIERLFNKILPRYGRGGSQGFFISGLYKDIIREDDVLSLNLTKYSASISGLGYRHSHGRLEIVGNKAYYIGMEMEGGDILINGNVGNYLGKSIKGGRIIVDGHARNWVGEKMEGGFILIKGDAGNIVGKGMTGGEIVIEGNVGYWVGDEARGGIIRVKDTEILP
jgi:formylmethanofuran dehydrogenase subunit C